MEASFFDSGSMKVTFRGLLPSQASQNVTQPPAAEMDMEGPVSAATHATVKVSAHEFSGAHAKQVVTSLTATEICDSLKV